MLQKNHLKVFIDELVVAFEEDLDIDLDVVLLQLQQFRDQLDTLQAEQLGAPPAGAESYHQNMVDIFKHFANALEHLEDFMDELDFELLKQASLEASLGDTKTKDFIDAAERQSDSIQALG